MAAYVKGAAHKGLIKSAMDTFKSLMYMLNAFREAREVLETVPTGYS